jgi:hypothetical protein
MELSIPIYAIWNKSRLFKLSRTGEECGCLVTGLHSMSFAHKTAMCPDFPDPVEQAAVILEICRDDICDARAIAMRNVKFARTRDDLRFWSRVEEELSADGAS